MTRRLGLAAWLAAGTLVFGAMFAGKADAALVSGDTFGIAMNYAPADQTSFEDANTTVTAVFATGTTINLGASAFDPTVTMNLFMEEDVISPTNSVITIDIFGTDALGNLANPLAAGSVAASGAPFTIAFMDFGVFNGAPNGASDRLDIDAPGYIVNSTFTGMISTAGEIAGSGGTTQTESPDGFSTLGGFNIGADIASADLGTIFGAGAFPTPGTLAGWRVEVDVTAVPEPSSMAILGVLATGALVVRRRRSMTASK